MRAKEESPSSLSSAETVPMGEEEWSDLVKSLKEKIAEIRDSSRTIMTLTENYSVNFKIFHTASKLPIADFEKLNELIINMNSIKYQIGIERRKLMSFSDKPILSERSVSVIKENIESISNNLDLWEITVVNFCVEKERLKSIQAPSGERETLATTHQEQLANNVRQLSSDVTRVDANLSLLIESTQSQAGDNDRKQTETSAQLEEQAQIVNSLRANVSAFQVTLGTLQEIIQGINTSAQSQSNELMQVQNKLQVLSETVYLGPETKTSQNNSTFLITIGCLATGAVFLTLGALFMMHVTGLDLTQILSEALEMPITNAALSTGLAFAAGASAITAGICTFFYQKGDEDMLNYDYGKLGHNL